MIKFSIAVIFDTETRNLPKIWDDASNHILQDKIFEQMIRSGATEFRVKVTDGACGSCLAHAGRVYTLEEIEEHRPPFHPNCRCTLVSAREGKSAEEILADIAGFLIAPFANRWQTLSDDPNLYNFLNWLTAGTLDGIKGTFFPEKPLSLQHWLDSLSTAFLLYGVFKALQGTNIGKPVGNTGGGNKANIPKSKVDEILETPKGSRPDPSTYLSKEYISEHLRLFESESQKLCQKLQPGLLDRQMVLL